MRLNIKLWLLVLIVMLPLTANILFRVDAYRDSKTNLAENEALIAKLIAKHIPEAHIDDIGELGCQLKNGGFQPVDYTCDLIGMHAVRINGNAKERIKSMITKGDFEYVAYTDITTTYSGSDFIHPDITRTTISFSASSDRLDEIRIKIYAEDFFWRSWPL